MQHRVTLVAHGVANRAAAPVLAVVAHHVVEQEQRGIRAHRAPGDREVGVQVVQAAAGGQALGDLALAVAAPVIVADAPVSVRRRAGQRGRVEHAAGVHAVPVRVPLRTRAAVLEDGLETLERPDVRVEQPLKAHRDAVVVQGQGAGLAECVDDGVAQQEAPRGVEGEHVVVGGGVAVVGVPGRAEELEQRELHHVAHAKAGLRVEHLPRVIVEVEGRLDGAGDVEHPIAELSAVVFLLEEDAQRPLPQAHPKAGAEAVEDVVVLAGHRGVRPVVEHHEREVLDRHQPIVVAAVVEVVPVGDGASTGPQRVEPGGDELGVGDAAAAHDRAAARDDPGECVGHANSPVTRSMSAMSSADSPRSLARR